MTGCKTTAIARRKFFDRVHPRERWTPSEWAERCRVLSNEESSEPGRYSFARTPYWRFVCDLIAAIGVQEIVCLKGAQIGWSELCRSIIGYWIDLDPGPCMILAPDEKSANDYKVERLEPLIEHTPAIKRHKTTKASDDTKSRIRLDSMSIFLVWAGSKTGTKARPIKTLVCEEPDEYPPFSGKGGDPLSKAVKRLTTYADKGMARILIGGTPTVRTGNIHRRWEMCPVRYHPWVPCPHCGKFQLLQWKQVRWPKLDEPDRAKRASRIDNEGLAHYECEGCNKSIFDHHKPAMLMRVAWATEQQTVGADGKVTGPTADAKRIGVKISSLYSPWVTFGTLASEWIESQEDPDQLADFVNQRLAEPFEEERAKTEPSMIREKANGAPAPMLVPKWARWLIASADTQGTNEQDGYFWYVIRAWGADYRSQLIDFGICHSKQELIDRCLNRQIPMEGGNPVAPQTLFVDSGGPRWSEVYQLAQSDPRIHPTKGDAERRRTWMVDERPQKKHGVVLWLIDTDQAKDLLHRLIHDPDRSKWLPHNQINDDYCRQMTSESKIYDPSTRQERWVEIVKNNNHLWDCESAQCCAAWRFGAGTPEPPAPVERPSVPEPEPSRESTGPSWANSWRGRY